MADAGFDFGLKALAEMWATAGRTLLAAQGEATQAMMAQMQGLPGLSAAFAGTAAPPPPGMSLADETFNVTEAAQSLTQAWQAATGVASTMANVLAGFGRTLDPTVEATFRAITDPRGWMETVGGMDSALDRIAEGVQLADVWNLERQQTRLLQAWLLVRRRALEHNVVVLNAWLRAGRGFAAELSQRPGAMTDPRALLTLWTETANRVLLETQRSAEYLHSQAAMVRAGTALREVQQEMAEQLAQQFGLPTRAEMDDVHRTVTELRREVRALQRARASAGGAAPA